MATLTATRTSQGQWKQLPTRSAYEASLKTLKEIRDANQGNQDILSQRLHRWIEKVISTPILSTSPATVESVKNDLARFQAKMEKRLAKLANDILTNPLQPGVPLESPLLDREWTWETWVLALYKKLTDRTTSPFDKKPIEEKPHLFARAMIAWAKTFKAQEPLMSHWDLVPDYSAQFKNDPQALKTAYAELFDLLAQRAITRKLEREFFGAAKKMVKDDEKRTAESDRLRKEESKKNAESIEAIGTKYKEGVAAHKKATGEKIAQIKAKQDKLEKEKAALEKTVHEVLLPKVEKLQTDNDRLTREIARRKQELAEIARRLQDLDDDRCIFM